MSTIQTDMGPLRVIEESDALTLEIAWQDQQSAQDKKGAVGASGALIITGVILWWLFEVYIFAAIALFFGLLFAYSTAATIFNKTCIRITPERIRARSLPIPFTSLLGAASFSQPAEDVKQIVVEKYDIPVEDSGIMPTYLVQMLNKDGSERKLFSFQGDPTVAASIEQRIEDFLGIEDDPDAKSRHYEKAQRVLNFAANLQDDDARE